MSSPILITGATGNVGSEILKRLVEKGAPTRAAVLSKKALKSCQFQLPGSFLTLPIPVLTQLPLLM